MPRMKDKPHRQPAAPSPDNDKAPRDIHELRLALARHISRAIADRQGAWRQCPQRGCRRARSCQTSRPECPALPPAPPMSPEEQARVRAGFGRMLRRRLDELARQADGIDQQS